MKNTKDILKLLLFGYLCVALYFAVQPLLVTPPAPEAPVVEAPVVEAPVVVEAEVLGYDLADVAYRADEARKAIITRFVDTDHQGKMDMVIELCARLNIHHPHGLRSDIYAVTYWFADIQPALSECILHELIRKDRAEAGLNPWTYNLILPELPTLKAMSRTKHEFWEGTLGDRMLLCDKLSKKIGKPSPVGWQDYDWEATTLWFVSILPDLKEFNLEYFTQLCIEIAEKDANK